MPRKSAFATLACIVAMVTASTASAAIGHTAGSASVDQGGGAHYSIPLQVPPGIAGVSPGLALTYSSRGANGYFGMGWDIAGLSSISRCPKTWAQDGAPREVRNDTSDRFCLDGQQLRLVSGTYGADGAEYRTEIESFAQVKSFGAAGNGPAYFVVKYRNGMIYEYGNTADSQILSVGQSTARTWAVNSVRDRSGNTMLYTYEEDATNGAYRISSIQYTQNAAAGVATPPAAVSFVYEGLPVGEVDSQYLANALIKRINRADRIDITYGGTLVRRYELTYESSLSVTAKSRLASVQECGGPSLDCLPATSFTYQNATQGFNGEVVTGIAMPTGPQPWTLDVNGDGRLDLVFSSSITSGAGTWMVSLANSAGGYDPAATTMVPNTNYSGATAIDYNSDGYDDLLVPTSTGTWSVMLGGNGGLAAPFDTGIPALGGVDNVRALDINGDGREDLVWAELFGYVGGDAIKYRLREAGATFSSTVYTLVGPLPADQQIINPFGGSSHSSLYRAPDFNGDGRGDFAYSRAVRNSTETGYHYNYSIRVVCPGELEFSVAVNQATAPYYGDFNGDGRTDLLYYKAGPGTALYYRFSTGTSFTGETAMGAVSVPVTVLDWDGDGFDDLLSKNTSTFNWNVYRSNGEQFTSATPVTGSGFNGAETVTDMNGDGLIDFGYVQDNVWKYRTHAGVRAELLANATDGTGQSATFNYVTLAQGNYTVRTVPTTFPEQDYVGALHVVSKLTQSTGVSTPAAYDTDFWYYDARMHLQGRGFEGFRSRRAIDSRTNLQSYDGRGQLFPYTGVPNLSVIKQSDGSTDVIRVTNTLAAHAYGAGNEMRYFPYISQAVTTRNELNLEPGQAQNGALLSTATTENTVDSSTGTVTDSSTTVVEAATANGQNSSTSHVHTFRTYHSSLFNDFTNWCIGRPETTQQINSHTLAGGTQVTRTTSRVWDGSMCRASSSTVEPSNSLWQVVTGYGFDAFGNINTVTETPASGQGQSARTTMLNWGTTGVFPVYVDNAKSQRTTFGWDYALGVRTSIEDPNHLTTTWTSDVFGRIKRELRPDLTATDFDLSWCSGACQTLDTNRRILLAEITRDSSNAEVNTTFHYIDMYDREIGRSSRILGGGYSMVHRILDARGLLAKISAPFIQGDPIQYSSFLYTTFAYDPLGRPTSSTRQTSTGDVSATTRTFAYHGLRSVQTDELNHQTTTVTNAVGWPVQVIDALSAATEYEYDAFGLLRTTRDAAGNENSATYNVRGMQMSSVDPDRGSLSYNYYPLGELKLQTNARGQSATFTYDALSRPVTRIEPEGTTTWVWDTATMGVGSLASVTSPGSYAEAYTYDTKGRSLQSRYTIDAVNYDYDSTYNATTGYLETLTYPAAGAGNRFKVKYSYQYGLPKSVAEFTGDVAGTVFWQANAMNAQRRLIDRQLGNGMQTISVYDPISGWLDSRSTDVGADTPQQLEYTWFKNSNLKSRKDMNQNITETFFYDALDRLDYSQLNGITNMDLAYDALGNISSKTGVGSYTYHATKKHAVTAAGSNTYTYDADGNMATRNGANVSWYSYNMPQTINGSGSNYATFYYAADRQRFKQEHRSWSDSSSVRTTRYAGPLFERAVEVEDGVTQTLWRHYIIAGNERVATHLKYTEPGYSYEWTSYFTQDHLGSIDGIYPDDEPTGSSYSYDAFGKRRGTAWTGNPTADELDYMWADNSNRGFTDHEHLDNLGLIHMNGRVFDPAIGRFLSADPIVQSPLNGQSLNRYSYAMNSPLSFTDPSGFNRERDHIRPLNPLSAGEIPRENWVTTTASRLWDMLPSWLHVNSGPANPNRSSEVSGGSAGGESKAPGQTIETVVVKASRIKSPDFCKQAEQLAAQLGGGSGGPSGGSPNPLAVADNILTLTGGFADSAANSTRGDAFMRMTSDAADRSALSPRVAMSNEAAFGPTARLIGRASLGVNVAQVVQGSTEGYANGGGVEGAFRGGGAAAVDAGVTTVLGRLGWPGVLSALAYNGIGGRRGIYDASMLSAQLQMLDGLMTACAFGAGG